MKLNRIRGSRLFAKEYVEPDWETSATGPGRVSTAGVHVIAVPRAKFTNPSEFGPSSGMPLSATRPRTRSRTEVPVSSATAALASTNADRTPAAMAPASCSGTRRAAPATTARSTPEGRSDTSATQRQPSIASYVGVTG